MRNWLLLCLLGIIWGASFLGAKLALAGFAPLTLAAMRISIGAACLLVIMAFRSLRPPPIASAQGRRIWLHIGLFAAFTNAIPFTLLNWAQLSVSSGFAGITMATVPLFVLPLAHVLLPGERMGPRRVFGFVLGFLGVVVLIGPAAVLEGGGSPLPRLACVAAACCYAMGSINTRLCPPVPTVTYSAMVLSLGAAMMLPLALATEGLPAAIPGPTAWGGTLFLGLFPTALATVILVAIVTSAGPSFLSLVNYQVPIWAVVFGVCILGEALPGSFALALGLILAGLCLSQWRDVSAWLSQRTR